MSYADPRDISVVLHMGQSVMMDNGAFSAFTRGKAFDLNVYYAWLEPILGHPHWAVVPDVIDGSVEQQREMTATWAFRREFGIPVWHLGMPIEYLLELCDGWGRVCFGSTAMYWKIGTYAWCGRMDEAFNALVRQFGKVPWVHGLRMLGQASGPWPLASADSTNLAQNFKLTGCAECKAQSLDEVNPPSSWTLRPIQEQML